MGTVGSRLAAHSSITRGSLVPGLNNGLPRDLAVLEFEHGRAEYFRSIRVGAALRERDPVAVRDSILQLVVHVASAHVFIKRGDRRLTFEFARSARRIFPVNDPHHGIGSI